MLISLLRLFNTIINPALAANRNKKNQCDVVTLAFQKNDLREMKIEHRNIESFERRIYEKTKSGKFVKRKKWRWEPRNKSLMQESGSSGQSNGRWQKVSKHRASTTKAPPLDLSVTPSYRFASWHTIKKSVKLTILIL